MSNIFADTLTAQQIFDHVVVQLALQGKPSMDGTACAYRGNNGTKCGVGFLLTDDEVRAVGNIVGVSSPYFIKSVPYRLRPHLRLLESIQMAHDTASVVSNFSRGVRGQLVATADQYGLEKGVLYAAFPDPAAPEQKAAPDAETRKIVALEPFPEGSSA